MRNLAQLTPPTDLEGAAARSVACALNRILADSFALYVKTKSFHWHVSGPGFHNNHRLFDEQADQILGSTDAMAERVRKIGGKTIKSVAQIAQRIRHAARTTDGTPVTHDAALVKRLLQEECDDILRLLKTRDAETEARYRKAVKIALQWIKNYTQLDYRSLGSYTRADLEKIAAAPAAL